jgi:histidine ammonia-lyase
MLSNSMYVHSIPNNNDNQDIVSMGTNSAVLTKRVIDNGFQVMAIHMIAVCQAIDILSQEQKERLSPKTIKVYTKIRKVMPIIKEDIAQFENIRNMIDLLTNTTIQL